MDEHHHRALERRSIAAAELRADVAGRKLEGLAAVFNQDARIANRFSERVLPGAFAQSLASGRDILALADHDPVRLLARTRSGTLRLNETAKGLAFSLDVPDTQDGRDLLTLAQRGDIGGASFAFTVQREAWPAPDKRELRQVELYEVSIVRGWPAYPQTFVQARGKEVAKIFAMCAARRRRLLEAL
jgi:HK97 family phage prohead protease